MTVFGYLILISTDNYDFISPHLSYRSHFKTKKSSLCEKKNAVYSIQISLFVPEKLKFLKYAN